MELALGILLDELAIFEPKIEKAISLKIKFETSIFFFKEP